MADVKLPSGRMLSQWQNCDPASMESMSKAAVRFALADAKTDILALAARVAELEGKAISEAERDFIERVAKQKPEKPDYWSSCSQCEHNISDAEDLIEERARATGESK